MEVVIRPKNFKLASGIETQVRKRIERLVHHVDHEDNVQSAEVLLSQQPTHLTPQRFQYVAQLTLHTRKNVIRSEVADPELLTAIDQAMDHLTRQIQRHKGRHYRRHKGNKGLGKSSADLADMGPLPAPPTVVERASPDSSDLAVTPPDRNGAARGDLADDEIGGIVRVKRFTVTPMFPEEALEQMELLGHDFFVFWNAADERMSVLYRRHDGDYGLLEPELA